MKQVYKIVFLVFISINLIINVSFSESTEEEAARRMPPVLYSCEIPDYFISGQRVTIKWTLLGYHEDYKSTITFFYGSGGSYSTNFESSNRLSSASSEQGNWKYDSCYSTLFHYHYAFTPPNVDEPTNIVIRFYRINNEDEDNGKSGLSLLLPGKISGRYYDTSGRRIVKTILPANTFVPNTNPDISSSHYTNNNPFHRSYSGQCTWFAWGRTNEITGVEIETLGNAKTWWINTQLPKGKTPLPDSIAIWNNDRQGNSSNSGHVAYVEYIDNNNIYYNEANVDTYGNPTPGCAYCGGGYDGYLKSSSKENFEDRGNSIGKISGYIYPSINIRDWWIKSSPTNSGEYWDAQFKVNNLGRSTLLIQDSRISIYRKSGRYVTSIRPDANTSIVLSAGDTYHHTFSDVKMHYSGNYFALPELKVNGEWIIVGWQQNFIVN